MHAHRLLSSLIVAVAMLTSASILAAAGPEQRRPVTTQKRVYDRSHNDYHMWDDHEDQAYRQYVGDQHMRYRGYSKLSRKQQTSYWKWRHTQGGDK